MKKKIFISILLSIMLITCSLTQVSYADNHSIESDMKVLASKEFMGRLFGTEGNEKAVNYVANRFSEIGLELYDDDYYHVSEQTIYDPEKQIHSLEVVFENGNTKQYEFGKDYVDRRHIKELDISAPITFDKNDQNMSEKIIVLEKSDPLFQYVNKCKVIFKRADSFFGMTGGSSYGTPYIEISDKLYNTLLTKEIKEVKLITRHIPEQADIKQVVGKISGKDHKKALVLSAHIDHVGYAGKTIFYGAVDDASGISVIMNIAEKLKKQTEIKPFDMDIIICAFNGEEILSTNGYQLVSELSKKYDEIYNINFDTLGKKDGGKITINGDPSLNQELIKDVFNCFSNNNYEILDKDYGGSDHVLFNRQGFCGITLGQIDVFGENNTTSIHTAEDTLKLVDYDQLYKVSDVVYDFIMTSNGKIYKPNLNN